MDFCCGILTVHQLITQDPIKNYSFPQCSYIKVLLKRVLCWRNLQFLSFTLLIYKNLLLNFICDLIFNEYFWHIPSYLFVPISFKEFYQNPPHYHQNQMNFYWVFDMKEIPFHCCLNLQEYRIRGWQFQI